MRIYANLAFSLLGLMCAGSANASEAVAADRNPVMLGQPVTLRWYFTGTKVVLSGGRFAAGTPVTGKTAITDKPTKTTKYTFVVDYLGTPAGAKDDSVKVPLHTSYSITVEVVDPKTMGLQTYTNPYGWSISYLNGWKRDKVELGDPANNALMYFQPEDDSVERLAVAIMPVKEASVSSLMKSLKSDLPSRYASVSVVSEEDIMYEGVPAIRFTFTGLDNSHPGVKTQTVLMAFVKDGKGYIVSARTAAARFVARQKVLETLVRSFLFSNAVQHVTQRPG